MSAGGRTFVNLTVLFGLTCLIFLIRFDKAEIHLAMDHWNHTPGRGERWVPMISGLGDMWMFIVVSLLLVVLKRPLREPVSLLIAGALVLMTTLILKFWAFPGIDRPPGYFGEGILHLVPGVEVLKHNSFPSGHATVAFTLYGMLAFWINRKWVSVSLFIVAVAVAYSQIYLNQHFLIDVFVGGLLGTSIAWLSYALVYRWNRKWLKKRVFGRNAVNQTLTRE